MHNIEGVVKLGIHFVCCVIKVDNTFDKNNPWLIAISKKDKIVKSIK